MPGDLEVAPPAGQPVLPGDVGQLADAGGVAPDQPRVEVGDGPLQGDGDGVLAHDARVANLDVPVEGHAGRPPVVDDVGPEVRVHEEAVGQAREHRAPLAVGVAQADAVLAPRVRAVAARGPEEVELEPGLEQVAGDRQGGLQAEPALAHAEDGLTVAAVLAVGGGDPAGPQGGVPVRPHPVEVLDEVGLGEAVDLEGGLAARLLGPARGREQRHGGQGRQQDGPHGHLLSTPRSTSGSP